MLFQCRFLAVRFMGLIRVLAGFGAFYPDCTPVGDYFSLDHEALSAKNVQK
jgi:hypothetical protein